MQSLRLSHAEWTASLAGFEQALPQVFFANQFRKAFSNVGKLFFDPGKSGHYLIVEGNRCGAAG